MKKILLLTILVFVFSFAFLTFSFTQGMMGNNLAHVDSVSSEASGNHAKKAEAEGKVFWDKLQAKEINCEDLSSDNFESLGMYFMGLMTGESHEAMDTMMEKMMGEDGEKQTHIAMGKRMSGCEPNAPMPGGMMQMMMGGGMMGGDGNSMMENFGINTMGWLGGGFGWILMILFWILFIVGIIVLIKWAINQQGTNQNRNSKPALEILKERYAKGEIDKKEFEEKKRDLI